MFLIYLPDGSNMYGARGGEFEGIGSTQELKVVKQTLPIHLFRHFCHKMYLLPKCTALQTDRGRDDSSMCAV